MALQYATVEPQKLSFVKYCLYTMEQKINKFSERHEETDYYINTSEVDVSTKPFCFCNY
jgi:hypothetical protein